MVVEYWPEDHLVVPPLELAGGGGFEGGKDAKGVGCGDLDGDGGKEGPHRQEEGDEELIASGKDFVADGDAGDIGGGDEGEAAKGERAREGRLELEAVTVTAGEGLSQTDWDVFDTERGEERENLKEGFKYPM
ncbi:hypothetical protein QJS04_geneDACA010202 [Acorus gramineus]|uniref:Uncharacterized protein n=1 Tax=Acorus gramineus TaxID=55184 RepID=A0AAV9A4Z2_ACOGR|nr:hypothetical protein QJS04_geneDACA010202 [Acorus gramineus]